MDNIFNEQYIKDSAFLLHHVNDIHFTPSFAIFAVTSIEALAKDERSIEAVSLIKRTMDMQGTPTSIPSERVFFIMNKAQMLPRLSETLHLYHIIERLPRKEDVICHEARQI